MTSWDADQTRQFICSSILQGWYFNHRCFKANMGRRAGEWRGQSSKVSHGDWLWIIILGCFPWEDMTMANEVACEFIGKNWKPSLHRQSRSDVGPRRGRPSRRLSWLLNGRLRCYRFNKVNVYCDPQQTVKSRHQCFYSEARWGRLIKTSVKRFQPTGLLTLPLHRDISLNYSYVMTEIKSNKILFLLILSCETFFFF